VDEEVGAVVVFVVVAAVDGDLLIVISVSIVSIARVAIDVISHHLPGQLGIEQPRRRGGRVAGVVAVPVGHVVIQVRGGHGFGSAVAGI